MKRKINLKVALLTCIYSLCLVTFCPIAANAADLPDGYVGNMGGNPDSPMKDNIGWKYKVENGKLYRRQYNYTKNVWIGDWELVGTVS